MTGLELLRAGKANKVVVPMGKTMNLDIDRIEEGYVEFRAVASEAHLNPMGGVHGGFAAAALDSSLGCAVHTRLAAGERYATVDLNIKMTKAIPVGKELTATGKVTHLGRTIAVSEGTLHDAEGTIYAIGSCTCVIRR